MKNLNLKIFITATFVFFGIFSLFFISSKKAIAQNPQDVVVKTVGYSALSINTYVFSGYYSGVPDDKRFTTYFEYKKDNDNLDTGAETTEKIDHSWSILTRVGLPILKSGDFYQSPELELMHNYSFRAVGYFNNDENKKYYGNILSFSTGNIPIGSNYNYPYMVDVIDGNGLPEPFVPPTISNDPTIIITPTACTIQQSYDPVFGCINHGCSNLQMWSPDLNNPDIDSLGRCETIPVIIPTNPNPPSPTIPIQIGTKELGLVPCDKNCGFNDVLKLINTVISFIFNDMVIPIAAIMFAYAGFELVTSGGSTEKKSKAKVYLQMWLLVWWLQ